MKISPTTQLQRLIDVGIALSAEHNTNRLIERMLLEAKDIYNADAGTLYLRTEDNTLKFEIMHTSSLDIMLGGASGKEISFPPIHMYDPKTGEKNKKNVATWAAISGELVNIADAYEDKEFDFSGTKRFDKKIGYRSKSFLTVPLKNSRSEVLGVLQLINAQDEETGKIIPFSIDVQSLIEALASQAAVAIEKQYLLDGQKLLLDSFIELIASAIDAKSPYTGRHCQRVPELTKMLAKAACDSTDKPYKDFNLTDDEWYELHISAWLHDCGKVTTPEYVVDKATKLETIYNRIHEIRMRFEVVKRDATIDCLQAIINGADEGKMLDKLEDRLTKLDDDYTFIAGSNVGGEFMTPAHIRRIKKIANIEWSRTLDDRIGISKDELKRKEREKIPTLPVIETLLADREDHVIYRDKQEVANNISSNDFKLKVPKNKYNMGEIYNLCIKRGTLTEEERFIINDHIVQTINMLEALPFPRHLKKVPEYAGGHHEKMDGTGYPKKLKRDDMSLPARIMAIADIFEALTAADRPYKTAKKLSESIKIMSQLKKNAHIDPELFDLFLSSGVYKDYAERFLDPAQIDDIDITRYIDKNLSTG